MTIAMLTLAIAGLSGCGSGRRPLHAAVDPGAPHTVTIPAGRPHLQASAPWPAARQGQPIGAAQHVRARAAALTVMVQEVLDPLSGSGASLPPGSRAIGVLVRIANGGPGIYDSSATGDVSIAVSAGPAEPVYAPAGICRTPDQDFDNYITPGQVRSGCVVFAVPRRAVVEAVRFSPNADRRARVAWRVRPLKS